MTDDPNVAMLRTLDASSAANVPAPHSGNGRIVGIFMVLLLLTALVPAAAVSAARPAVASFDLEARYEVSVFLRWSTRRVTVKTTIELLNDSGGPVDRLELNTVAAKLSTLKGLQVKVDGSNVNASVSGQTIKVPLGSPLPEGASARVFVSYRARLLTSTRGRDYFWTKSNGVAQMYRFIPWLSRKIPFGTQRHGEPFLTPNSPRARVTVNSDRPLIWATSGRRVARNGNKITFLAKDVRDFSLTASPAYKTVSGRSRDGDTRIFVHTRSLDGRRLLRLAREELARYEARTGIEYPHPTYRIAESGGGLAIESPGLVWIPGDRAASDLPYLVSHETAHQWFYAIVGNDQSTNAFADEALAEYYSRKAHLSMRPSRCKADRLDRNIRDYSSRCYYEVIYVQGARFLDRLRRDFGASRFKRAIKAYSQENRNGIGSNVKLLEAFRAEMGNAVLPRYKNRFPSLY
ncbi:MAG: hypothetical protein ACC726_05890 [Chloroflexota bacterium]